MQLRIGLGLYWMGKNWKISLAAACLRARARDN